MYDQEIQCVTSYPISSVKTISTLRINHSNLSSISQKKAEKILLETLSGEPAGN